MLFRPPMIPLEPAAHSPTSPPMSPIPGTWQTPPGRAGVTSAASLAGEEMEWAAGLDP